MDIGKKLRSLRLGLNLTQEELANKLELTKGYISQLENNLTSPSLQTLFSILSVLGSDIHQFFGKDEEEQIVVYRKDEVKQYANKELKHIITKLVPNALKYEMEPIIIEIEPGGQSEMNDPHPGEEFGYVLEGQVTLVLSKKRYTIRKGESFYYQANKEHYVINNSSAQARVLWISSPPIN
jgi:transcriptional regulator with XRE-family HTH domain